MAVGSRGFPLTHPRAGSTNEGLRDGIALCLSGGGYRAMLFHVGTLWRLHELGILASVERISSVSGGSITAGWLALRWNELHHDSSDSRAFERLIAEPLIRFARKTIDARIVLRGLFPRSSPGDRLRAEYRRHLFGDATLQDLPATPLFVFNATNLQSGVLFRFSRPYIWDYRVGKIARPRVPLADAVAASSAFPPVLSPVSLHFDHAEFEPGSGDDLQRPPFTTEVHLTDGGVYDNLGLESAWKLYRTILVSDAGSKIEGKRRPRLDWLNQSARTLSLIDNQVRSLRKRQLIEAFRKGERAGGYWSIRSNPDDFAASNSLRIALSKARALAALPTRLKALPERRCRALIDWGYGITDIAIRSHLDDELPSAIQLPYGEMSS